MFVFPSLVSSSVQQHDYNTFFSSLSLSLCFSLSLLIAWYGSGAVHRAVLTSVQHSGDSFSQRLPEYAIRADTSAVEFDFTAKAHLAVWVIQFCSEPWGVGRGGEKLGARKILLEIFRAVQRWYVVAPMRPDHLKCETACTSRTCRRIVPCTSCMRRFRCTVCIIGKSHLQLVPDSRLSFTPDAPVAISSTHTHTHTHAESCCRRLEASEWWRVRVALNQNTPCASDTHTHTHTHRHMKCTCRPHTMLWSVCIQIRPGGRGLQSKTWDERRRCKEKKTLCYFQARFFFFLQGR